MGYAGLCMTEPTAPSKEEPLGTVPPHLRLDTRRHRRGDFRLRGIGRVRGGMPALGFVPSQWTIPCQQ
jgi:hypothetical protein